MALHQQSERQETAASNASEAQTHLPDPTLMTSSSYFSISSNHSDPLPTKTTSSPLLTDSRSLKTPQIAILFSAPLVGEDISSITSSHPTANSNSLDSTKTNIKQLTPLPTLDYDREKSLLLKSLTLTSLKLTISSQPATADSLRALLTQNTCRVMHYCGHGHADYIPFENSRGGVHALTTQKLKSLLLAGGGSYELKLVFVNSRFSANAGQTFADCGVAHVVCCGGGSYATQFMRSFYLALVTGNTVRASFEIGKASVFSAELHPEIDTLEQSRLFTLLPLNGNHDVPIFTNLAAGSCVDITQTGTRDNLPSVPCNFSGRQFDLYSLVDRILKNRLVTLTGGFGTGKSTLAISAARYLSERGFFSVVCHVKVSSVVSLRTFVMDSLKELVGLPNNSNGNNNNAGGSGEKSNSDDDLHRRSCNFSDRVTDIQFLQRIKDLDVLLVLDGSKNLIDSGALKQFRSLLKILLTHTTSIKIILTSSKSAVGRLTFVTESVLEMQPLSNVDVAKMQMSRAPVLRRGFNNACSFVDTISNRKALDFLHGNPYAIGLCCTLLQSLPEEERDMDHILLRFQQHSNSSEVQGVLEGVNLKGDRGNLEIRLLVDDIINIKNDSASEDDEEEEDRVRLDHIGLCVPMPYIRPLPGGGGGRVGGGGGGYEFEYYDDHSTSNNSNGVSPAHIPRERLYRVGSDSSSSNHDGLGRMDNSRENLTQMYQCHYQNNDYGAHFRSRRTSLTDRQVSRIDVGLARAIVKEVKDLSVENERIEEKLERVSSGSDSGSSGSSGEAASSLRSLTDPGGHPSYFSRDGVGGGGGSRNQSSSIASRGDVDMLDYGPNESYAPSLNSPRQRHVNDSTPTSNSNSSSLFSSESSSASSEARGNDPTQFIGKILSSPHLLTSTLIVWVLSIVFEAVKSEANDFIFIEPKLAGLLLEVLRIFHLGLDIGFLGLVYWLFWR